MNETARDTSDAPVMPRKCPTCPFQEQDALGVREWVEGHIYTESSQICHHHQLHGIAAEYLCRGAFDEQCKYFHSIGFLDEPTQAAWDAKREELGMKPRRKTGLLKEQN